MTSDSLTAINRVAELIPAVAAKTVVYGGTGRQSRSDCAVVPLAEFAGVLERFDVDQDVASFVQERKGSAPNDADVTNLDTAYHTHVRRTLDALESAFQPLEEDLFRRLVKIGYVKLGQEESSSRGLLEARHWEELKKGYLIGPGFRLSDNRPLELRHDYLFTGYTGSSDVDFNVRLSITWKLNSEYLSRSASINEARLSELDTRIAYPQLDEQGADADHVVAQVLQAPPG